MHLTPKEIDKLMLLNLGMIAERRKNKGLKLNYPEAVAYITSAALEEARAGKTVEEVMVEASNVLTKDDVMPGVADMISLLQVEAVFTDGSRLVSIHHPIIIRKSKNPAKPKRKVQNPAKIGENHNSKRLLKYKSRNIGMIKKSIGSQANPMLFFAY